MEKLFKLLAAMDWLVSGGSVAYGLVTQNWWYVAGGVLGLCLAFYRPSERIRAVLEKRFLRKKARTDDSAVAQAEDVFYASVLGQLQDESAPAAAATGPRQYHDTLPAYGRVLLSGSKHNQLRAEHVQVLASAPEALPKVPRYF